MRPRAVGKVDVDWRPPEGRDPHSRIPACLTLDLGEDLDVLNRRPTALNTNYRRALRSGGPNGQILPGNKGAGPGRLLVRKRLKNRPELP